MKRPQPQFLQVYNMSGTYRITVHQHNCTISRSIFIIHLYLLVPDSPTDLQAVNITDSKALLVWKPAQAKVDHYILSYGSTRCKPCLCFKLCHDEHSYNFSIPYIKYISNLTAPNVTVTVMLSGTSVEHQLRGLHRSTFYAVKIMSQLSSLQSSSVSTSFTTKSGKAECLNNWPSFTEH